MGPLDTFWHLSNFFLPALAVGAVSAAVAKLLWRRQLKVVTLRVLSLWAIGACALALVAGLLVFGRDGRLESYAFMLLVCTASLWWKGLRRGR